MEKSNALNETFVTFDGYVDLRKFRYFYFVLMLLVYIFIIISNITIGCLIWTHKSLHEPMYIFIAALLLNSVLHSTSIYPKMLADFLSEKQVISYSACLMQFVLFYCLAGSEVLLLAAMSYDRYVSICKPLQYPNMVTNTTVIICLGLAWFVPPLHSAIPIILLNSAQIKLCQFTLKGIYCNNAIYTLQCVRSRTLTIFGVFAVTDLIILPMLFIVFTYSKILIISYQSCKEVRKKAAETCLPQLLVLINLTALCVYDISTARIESEFTKTTRFIMALQMVLYHPLLNPLIYGLKMKQIHYHLKRLLWRDKII